MLFTNTRVRGGNIYLLFIKNIVITLKSNKKKAPKMVPFIKVFYATTVESSNEILLSIVNPLTFVINSKTIVICNVSPLAI